MKLILTESQVRKFLNEFDYSDAVKLEKAAMQFYGVTESPSAAGYITPNGYLIDFSEGTGARVQDHRNIEFLFNKFGIDLEKYGKGKWKNSSSAGMYAAIDMGFIRYLPESNGFDMRDMPTQEQFQVLRKILRMNDGESIFDFGDNVHMEYDKGTPVDYIINSIKNYYRDGMIPQPYMYADDWY